MNLESFITIALVHFLGIISPGPNIISITRHAINHGMNGISKFSFGIVIGQFIYIFGAIFGLTKLIFKFYYFKLAFYLVSAIYLGRAGFKMFKIKSHISNEIKEDKTGSIKNPFSFGIILTISNPGAAIFYSSILANFINENSSNLSLLFLLIYLSIATFAFFYFAALVFSKMRGKVDKYRNLLDKIFALMLIYFSVKLFYSTFKLIFT